MAKQNYEFLDIGTGPDFEAFERKPKQLKRSIGILKLGNKYSINIDNETASNQVIMTELDFDEFINHCVKLQRD